MISAQREAILPLVVAGAGAALVPQALAFIARKARNDRDATKTARGSGPGARAPTGDTLSGRDAIRGALGTSDLGRSAFKSSIRERTAIGRGGAKTHLASRADLRRAAAGWETAIGLLFACAPAAVELGQLVERPGRKVFGFDTSGEADGHPDLLEIGEAIGHASRWAPSRRRWRRDSVPSRYSVRSSMASWQTRSFRCNVGIFIPSPSAP